MVWVAIFIFVTIQFTFRPKKANYDNVDVGNASLTGLCDATDIRIIHQKKNVNYQEKVN